MQRQYRAIKRELPPGSILMFRLGDFYEMFGEDAVIASPILGATLTQRAGAPLCGIPYHALDAYLAKLIRAGKTAAICDQMEDPRLVKKGQVVRREVTRIVMTPTDFVGRGFMRFHTSQGSQREPLRLVRITCKAPSSIPHACASFNLVGAPLPPLSKFCYKLIALRGGRLPCRGKI